MELQDVRDQIAEQQQRQFTVTPQQREEVLKLAGNLPRLWNSSSSSKDKKRILQLLIQDITIEKRQQSIATLHIRWHGGLTEDIEVELPRRSSDRWRHSDELVQRVRELARKLSDQEIAAQFNEEGLKSNKGNAFTRSSISWIRHKHAIAPVDKKKQGELTVKELAGRFGVGQAVVYEWIAQKLIPARRLNHGSPYWITISPETEEALKKRVSETNRIKAR